MANDYTSKYKPGDRVHFHHFFLDDHCYVTLAERNTSQLWGELAWKTDDGSTVFDRELGDDCFDCWVKEMRNEGT